MYNFQTGIANRSILVKKHYFIAKLISWPWEGAIQHEQLIIYNFITLDSISTATTVTEYCRITYASNMLIWTKFMTPYQNFVLPLMILHILLKTTLLLLFVTSLQAQISAFNCTSMLNEGPSPHGFSAKKKKKKKKKFPPQNRGAPYTQVRLIHRDLRYAFPVKFVK